ncbi:hypothetical protein [Nostoc sp.]|uniref:hypothetical protein n=1 Tax=Nostoc sp. TaxID=1180 RepID=UPI002FFB51A2
MERCPRNLADAESQSPGSGQCGGGATAVDVAIATMLTLFIIPCFYILLHDLLGGNWAKPVFIRLRRFTKKLI